MNGDLTGVAWFKSSYSQGGSDCVDVAFLENSKVGVRDSKNPAGPALTFTPTMWDSFTAGVQAGRFDRPVRRRSGILNLVSAMGRLNDAASVVRRPTSLRNSLPAGTHRVGCGPS
ncbi:DUF397 domain-containing protein [Nocardia uniformis]|uniref:DUF397 domain-containing protein n=1 Tax=Nocardia uniformis TaxID=53432 RepID=UPI000A05CFEA|nr:DUF397 domain-containing protein [Nocardia uniformis]